jgi:iron complex transport system ATP-binding protein
VIEAAASGSAVQLAYNGKGAVGASDFTIPRGALTAVIGPNGSGKSTLLNALTGLVKIVAGRVEVFGRAPSEARERVAYVLQAATVNEVMPITVRDVVAMGRYGAMSMLARLGPADRAICDSALERLGISALKSRQLHDLSGGQRQRVFVAQGLAQQADILLLDEPLTGLDLASRERIVLAIDAELDARRTVVLTTHDLAEAAVADHVILMTGRVAAQGSPAEVLQPDLLSAAYGIGLVHLEDGTTVLDDAAHAPRARHIHFERAEPRRD